MHPSAMVLVATLAVARWSCATCESSANASSLAGVVQRTFAECAPSTDLLRCIQIRALKMAGRAARHPQDMQLLSGVEVLRVSNTTMRQARQLMSDIELQKLDTQQLNELLMDSVYDFLETHVIKINLSKLVEQGRGGGGGGGLGGFGGGKKKNRYAGPFMAALAMKGIVMTMAYKGIAIMAGSALIIGKIALVLAAILGLKKLVSSDKEKTTVEIVKHPSHSSSHTHSSSYEEADGHYRRSMPTEEDIMILDNITRDSFAF